MDDKVIELAVDNFLSKITKGELIKMAKIEDGKVVIKIKIAAEYCVESLKGILITNMLKK